MSSKNKKLKKLKSIAGPEVQLPNIDLAPPLKKVLIVTPCYGGQVSHLFMHSVLEVVLRGPSRGYSVETYTLTDSLVTRARNNAVATFLDGTWDYLFWIDADISFEAEQFFRLLDIDRDITAAAYPLKKLFYPSEPTRATGQELAYSMLRYALNLQGDITNIPEDGFVSVFETATGFMCIKRSVLDAMRQEYPHLRYKSDMVGLGAPDSQNHYLFFDTMVHDERYLSEDYAFCKRVTDMGLTIWMDIRSKLVHSGNYDYRGSLLDTAAS